MLGKTYQAEHILISTYCHRMVEKSLGIPETSLIFVDTEEQDEKMIAQDRAKGMAKSVSVAAESLQGPVPPKGTNLKIIIHTNMPRCLSQHCTWLKPLCKLARNESYPKKSRKINACRTERQHRVN